jgi:hypothetical protein
MLCTAESCHTGVSQPKRTHRRGRAESVAHLAGFDEAATAHATSQRRYASETGVPRSTLQHWLKRRGNLDASPGVVRFFESPEGLAFLHRLSIASHFVMGFVGPLGLRRVQLLFSLAGVSRFIANSYGVHQKLGHEMENLIGQFGQQEVERLSSEMSPKTISVCQDETFHPRICLVGIEPVSDFILLEKYVERRDGKTWNEAMSQATKGLPLRIIQSTSDEGKGLLLHAKEGLGAHHSPDLFHVQQELSRATSAPLGAQVRGAEKTLGKRKKTIHSSGVAQAAVRMETFNSSASGAAPATQATQETQETRQAEDALAQAQQRRERARQSNRKLGEVYHPVDLKTGTLQSADTVKERLEGHIDEIAQIAREASLSEACHERIEKARRVIPLMVATVAFFHRQVHERIEALGLPAAEAQRVEQSLLPRAYLERAVQKAATADARDELRERVANAAASGSDKWLAKLDPQMQARIDKTVQECADLFQRSSSCVEGRNGQLSLWHHSLHHLSGPRLEALTVIHNYFIRRRDGTTAAERFFGIKHAELFDWLLDHLNVPARPAKQRARNAQEVLPN